MNSDPTSGTNCTHNKGINTIAIFTYLVQWIVSSSFFSGVQASHTLLRLWLDPPQLVQEKHQSHLSLMCLWNPTSHLKNRNTQPKRCCTLNAGNAYHNNQLFSVIANSVCNRKTWTFVSYKLNHISIPVCCKGTTATKNKANPTNKLQKDSNSYKPVSKGNYLHFMA